MLTYSKDQLVYILLSRLLYIRSIRVKDVGIALGTDHKELSKVFNVDSKIPFRLLRKLLSIFGLSINSFNLLLRHITTVLATKTVVISENPRDTDDICHLRSMIKHLDKTGGIPWFI